MKILYEGLSLRPWTLADAADLAAMANEKRIADNLRDAFPHPYSLRDAEQWLSAVIPDNIPAKFFVIEYEGVMCGSIGLSPKTDIYRKSCEIGYYVIPAFWGRGIATSAIKAVTGYAFRTFDIVRVYAEPFADNAGSRKALEKAGYKLEATLRNNVIKNGIIKNSCIYAILREEFI